MQVFFLLHLSQNGRQNDPESLESAYPQDCLKGNLRSVGCCRVLSGRFVAVWGCSIKWCESQIPVGSVIFLWFLSPAKYFYTTSSLLQPKALQGQQIMGVFVCVFLIDALLILIDRLFLFTGFFALPRFPQCGFRISTPALRSISPVWFKGLLLYCCLCWLAQCSTQLQSNPLFSNYLYPLRIHVLLLLFSQRLPVCCQSIQTGTFVWSLPIQFFASIISIPWPKTPVPCTLCKE